MSYFPFEPYIGGLFGFFSVNNYTKSLDRLIETGKNETEESFKELAHSK